MLTDKQRRFAAEYAVDLNATRAAVRAGYSEKTAYSQGQRLLKNVEVQAAVADCQKQAAERLGATTDRVLRELVDIAFADPNELVEFRRQACQACWGGEAPVEEDQEPQAHGGSLKRTRKAQEPPAALEGPDPACTSCGGRGAGFVHVHDSRRLRGPARRLYAGVKQTRDGIQVLMRSQDKALELLGQHLGMFKLQHEHTGKDGGPIEVDETAAAARIAAILAAAEARRKAEAGEEADEA